MPRRFSSAVSRVRAADPGHPQLRFVRLASPPPKSPPDAVWWLLRGAGRRGLHTPVPAVPAVTYWADYVGEDCCFCKGSGAAARYPIATERPPAA
jgi:hypothetical protein